jgi:hypothetical protein
MPAGKGARMRETTAHRKMSNVELVCDTSSVTVAATVLQQYLTI